MTSICSLNLFEFSERNHIDNVLQNQCEKTKERTYDIIKHKLLFLSIVTIPATIGEGSEIGKKQGIIALPPCRSRNL
jgi:hypothetical protein